MLHPPDPVSFDIENANTSSETIYPNSSPLRELSENGDLNSPKSEEYSEIGNSVRPWSCKNEFSGEMALLDCDESGNFDFGTGLTHRKIKNRENGSNYYVNDNDSFFDIDPAALNVCDR